jgi:hypothetical protein
VIDVQDFDILSFQGIDHDVRERRECQFSCTGPMAGLPRLGEVFRERMRW